MIDPFSRRRCNPLCSASRIQPGQLQQPIGAGGMTTLCQQSVRQLVGLHGLSIRQTNVFRKLALVRADRSHVPWLGPEHSHTVFSGECKRSGNGRDREILGESA